MLYREIIAVWSEFYLSIYLSVYLSNFQVRHPRCVFRSL